MYFLSHSQIALNFSVFRFVSAFAAGEGKNMWWIFPAIFYSEKVEEEEARKDINVGWKLNNKCSRGGFALNDNI